MKNFAKLTKLLFILIFLTSCKSPINNEELIKNSQDAKSEQINTKKSKNKPPQQHSERSSRRQLGIFVEPQGLIVDSGARVMSLQDGTSKMSKSAPNEDSRALPHCPV